jgi:hypothetical protein
MTKPVPTAGVRLDKKVKGKPLDGAGHSKDPNCGRIGGTGNRLGVAKDYKKGK